MEQIKEKRRSKTPLLELNVQRFLGLDGRLNSLLAPSEICGLTVKARLLRKHEKGILKVIFMTESIMQDKEECYITGSRHNLHRHHCLHGIANRKIADKYGLWVYLRSDIHARVHESDKELDRQLEEDAQRAFEAKYGHELWTQLFRKNYI